MEEAAIRIHATAEPRATMINVPAPRGRDMPPPRNPPQRRVIAQEEARLSADDDSSVRPTGCGKAKGKGKPDKWKGKSDKEKGKGDKGGRRQDGSRPPRPKGGEPTRSPPATRHR